jgi:hypothetical protein
MLFLRVLGKTLLIVAFLALAYDGARYLATPTQGLQFATIASHLKTHIPNGYENLHQFFLSQGSAYLWSSIAEPVLALPISIFCGVLGTLLYLAGYRRPPHEIVGD